MKLFDVGFFAGRLVPSAEPECALTDLFDNLNIWLLGDQPPYTLFNLISELFDLKLYSLYNLAVIPDSVVKPPPTS
ncbi:hypothetical protein QUF91_13140 [Lysinibacillus sp. G4S2]|nr:hypothetical protein [Lysinibacillus sp. G4S2]